MLSETLGTLTNPEITELMDSLELILEGDEKIQNFIDNYKNNTNISAIKNKNKNKYEFKYHPKGLNLPITVKFNPFNKKALLKIEFNYLFVLHLMRSSPRLVAMTLHMQRM